MSVRLKRIKARKVEIRSLLQNGEQVDLAALTQELDALEVEERGLQDLENRLEIAGKLNNEEIRGNEIKKPDVEIRAKNIEFNPDSVLESAEYRSAYLKTLQGVKLNEVEERAMMTVSNNSAVVPTQTLNKIVEKLKQVSVIFPMVTALNIPSNVTIPVENVNTDASWVAEATASTDGTDLTTASISLAAYKLIKTLEFSANIESMSIDAFESFIVTALSNKIKIAIDAAIITGNGTTQAEGIVTAITAVETAESTGWTYQDILDLLSGLSSMYATNAVIVVNRKTLYKRIASIKDTTGKPIFVVNAENGFAGKIMGYPVKTYDALADDKIIFGDFTYYYFNIVKDFGIEKNDAVGFRTGSTVYRVMALCDGKVALEEAFVVQNLKAGSSS